ncbi:MAG: hypothetical protein WAL32_01820 [Terriglobales bacterium]
MKSKATLLILGICLAALASVATPAYAATELTQSGFSAFRVQYGSVDSYSIDPNTCLVESYGAVINYCTSEGVALVFDTPILKSGSHSVTITDLWFGQSVSFPCNVYAYTGTESSFTDHTTVTFTGLSQTLSTKITVPAGGYMQAICVLPEATSDSGNGGTGIAKITWTP